MPKSFVHLHQHTEFCLSPGTLVATDDLRWVPVGEVCVGDGLVGFDEDLRNGKSKMRKTVVTGTKRVIRDCFRITLEDGTVIEASSGHGWVTVGPTRGSQESLGGPVRPGYGGNARHWVTTTELRPGKSKLILWAKPWGPVPTQLEKVAGYLAGIFDGEGWISHGQVALAQNAGPVANEILQSARLLGYEMTPFSKNKCITWCFRGYETAMRFASQCSPIKLANRADEIWVDRKAGGKFTKPVLVYAVEHIGEQETIAVETTLGTLVAGGFLSHNSMLDGAAKVDELVAAAAADGQPALGMTDHGNMYGALDFYKACNLQGVKPIIGTEAYMAKDHRTERPTRSKGGLDDSGGETERGEKMYYHLTLLAENNVGYQNLIQIASRAYLEGYYYKPRVDWEVLNDHSDGVIATTGCLGGQVLQALLRDNPEAALKIAARLQDIFGRDNLFVEIQDHGIADQKRTLGGLFDIAKRLNAPLLATNDGHYVHKHDALAHSALLCVQTKTQLSNPDRFKFEGDEHYLKSSHEMRSLFTEHPDACDNTLWIAERANLELSFGKALLPDFPIPEGFVDAEAYLAELVFQGAEKRWGRIDDRLVSRLALELRTIIDMGFSAYFLIVWDLIRHAKEAGIRVGPGRGSAAGCAVAYALGITELDPLKYNLLFERFLNPSRISMPDIDIDFDSRYRDEMIRYAAQKYGEDHVAQIVTFSQIKARAAVRDATRVLGHPFTLGNRIVASMPPLSMGRSAPLDACFVEDEEWIPQFAQAQELRDLYSSDPNVKEVIDVAKGLEGLRRQDSIHASAVVITKEPLTEYLPIQRKPERGKSIEDAPVVTQYEMHGVEDLGLLKMDFLGLKNLDVIEECLRLLRQTGVEVGDINDIPLDDKITFDLLGAGQTVGVFQLESKGMQELLQRLRPTSFDDIAALVALYRPGPMAANMHTDFADRKNHRQAMAYFHDDASEILADTYGLMIYQEQVMQVAQKFAGYSLAEADNLRKAIGKKIRSLMASEREKFIQGCETEGYGSALGEHLFTTIESFADYCFCRSHAYGYGLIAYQTAYLKANFSSYYMAALCTATKDIEAQSIALAAARKMGVEVRLPSINLSSQDFTASPTGIRVGLSKVRHVGGALADKIIEVRGDGPFTDPFDFCFRMKMSKGKLAKRGLLSLIEAGALDEFGQSRLGLRNAAELILEQATKQADKAVKGQLSLFDKGWQFNFPPDEYTPEQKLALEKHVLGIYVSGHPMDGLDDWVAESTNARLSEVDSLPEEQMVWVAGVVQGIELRTTRNNEEMARFTVEDHESMIPVVAFPKNWAKVRDFIKEGSVYLVNFRTTMNARGWREYVLIAATPREEEQVVSNSETEFRLFLPEGLARNDQAISKLKGVLLSHRGPCRVKLHYGAKTAVSLPDDYRVQISPELVASCKLLFKET